MCRSLQCFGVDMAISYILAMSNISTNLFRALAGAGIVESVDARISAAARTTTPNLFEVKTPHCISRAA
jgi:hypothetical protein